MFCFLLIHRLISTILYRTSFEVDWNLDGLFPFAVLLPFVNLLLIWIVKNRTFLFEIMLGQDCQILKLRNKFRKQIDRHMRHPVLEPYFKCVHENVLSVHS